MIDTGKMYNDVFSHLAYKVEYQTSSTSFSVLAIINNPENAYEMGGSEIIGQVAEISLRARDFKTAPRMQDKIIFKKQIYRIFTEPLLNSSNEIYKMLAVRE